MHVRMTHIRIDIRADIHPYAHTHTHTHLHLHTYTHIHTCTHTHTYTHTHTHKRTHIHKHTQTYSYLLSTVRVLVCMYLYVYVYTQTRRHVYTDIEESVTSSCRMRAHRCMPTLQSDQPSYPYSGFLDSDQCGLSVVTQIQSRIT